MKKGTLLMKSLLIIITLLLSTSVLSTVDFDTIYSCEVIESTHPPTVGRKTLPGYTFNQTLANSGMISGTGITIYNSSVKKYHNYSKNSGYVVIASDFTLQNEFQGTIFIDEMPDHLILNVSIFHAHVLYNDQTGERMKVLSPVASMILPEEMVSARHKLKCVKP